MYELIEHKKLDAAATAITFSNIPSNGTDLLILFSLRSASGDDQVRLFINGSSADFSRRALWGSGSSVGSQTSDPNLVGWTTQTNQTASTFGSGQIYIPNYTSSNAKSISTDVVMENNATFAYQTIAAMLWNNSAAVNSISLQNNGNNWAAGSSVSIYKVNRTQAIGRPKAVGGNITYANGYWVHTFTGSGTFYAQEDLELEYLVVAGGGGGTGSGNNIGNGGGGAGGYRSSVAGELSGGNGTSEKALSVSAASSIPVVVGAGGVGGIGIADKDVLGTSGMSSFFGPISATGGGAGGGYLLANGAAGGSGGGGASNEGSTANTAGGAGTNGEGYAGGTGNNSTISGQGRNAGGGGGAGASGVNGSNSAAGAGGAGVTSSITGTAVIRAGGGGGGIFNATAGGTAVGAGGAGGGGAGGSRYWSVVAQNGTSNTGGGGGGTGGWQGQTPYNGGNGGSGVVIVRYKAD